MSQFETVLLIALIVIPGFDFIVAAILWWSVRTSPPPVARTLIERAWVATAIWVGVSIIAALGLFRAVGIPLDAEMRTLVLAAAILLPSAVNALWLIRFLAGGFGK